MARFAAVRALMVIATSGPLAACLSLDLGPAGDPIPTPAPDVDHDGDGVPLSRDCDDTDPDRSPGLPERCADEADNDCDDAVDEVCACGPTDLAGSVWAADALGAPGTTFSTDAPPVFEARLRNPCNNAVALDSPEPCFGRLSVLAPRASAAVATWPASCGTGQASVQLAPGDTLSLTWPWSGATDAGQALGTGEWRVAAAWANGAYNESTFTLEGCSSLGCEPTATPTATRAPTPTDAPTPSRPAATPTECPEDTDDNSDEDTDEAPDEGPDHGGDDDTPTP